ncbi:MAG: hypothetical protein GX061_01630 [Eubacteriaceae bacterium]|nr:hypothetical protein [Eubacteriaceae bacterium]
MKIGIIDAGSNTIKAFIYEITRSVSGSAITVIAHRSEYAMLLTHIRNGYLTDEGLKVLKDSCLKLKYFIEAKGVYNIRLFGTAALRSAINRMEITNGVLAATGMKIDILSAEQEALCDALSMSYFSRTEDGIGMDIGGGSGQIFVFEGGELKSFISSPIGALYIKERFVKGAFPVESEERAIRDFVVDSIKDIGKHSADILYVMGGSAVSAKAAMGITEEEAVIPIEEMDKCRKNISSMENPARHISAFAPGRETTLLPGMLIISYCAEYFGAKSIRVFTNSAREGYIIKNNYFI